MKFNVCQIIRTNLLFVRKLELNDRETEAIPRGTVIKFTRVFEHERKKEDLVDLENKPEWYNQTTCLVNPRLPVTS